MDLSEQIRTSSAAIAVLIALVLGYAAGSTFGQQSYCDRGPSGSAVEQAQWMAACRNAAPGS